MIPGIRKRTMEEKMESYDEKCPLRRALELIGGKWKLPVLWILNTNGVMRYNALKKELHGITNTMLANTLEELIRDGLVLRRQYNEMPLRVEYSLTERGSSLFPALKQLAAWGSEQHSLSEDA